jgi:hypothetical protein
MAWRFQKIPLKFPFGKGGIFARKSNFSIMTRPPWEEGKCEGLHFNPNSLAAFPPKTFSLSSTDSPSMPLIAETCPASIIGVG